MAKQATSFRLSEEAVMLIKDLSERLGISQADVVEMAVRLLSEEKLPRPASELRLPGETVKP